MIAPDKALDRSNMSIAHGLRIVALVALVIFAASLFGILTRPLGFLAAFWPANAILLGMMVRFRPLASGWGGLGAILGYLAAVLLTGGQFHVTFWLTAANLTGAVTGVLLYRLVSPEDRSLGRPRSVLFLFAICGASASLAATVGGGLAPSLFGKSFLTGLEFWFVTEFVNSIVILPTILTFPGWVDLRKSFDEQRATSVRTRLERLMPMLALAASAVLSTRMGGPGAIAIPVPALLWCALSYGLFTTSLLTTCLCAWLLIGVSSGSASEADVGGVLQTTSSLRLGVALLALGPLTVASVNLARSEALRHLAYAADHDSLTGLLNRGAFMRLAGRWIEERARRMQPFAVMMVDLDHFKRINDDHGHAFGDMVLQEFAKILEARLGHEAIVGRIGGEEFALAVSGSSMAAVRKFAVKLQEEVAGKVMMDSLGRERTVTVSVGLTMWTTGVPPCLDTLLSEADEALYKAKTRGRNRVVMKAA